MMADYFCGKIEVPRKYAETPEIKEMLEEHFEDVDVCFCLGFHAPASDKVLEFADNGARYGEFPELEKFLVEHKIPFDRYSTSHYEYEPKVASYRPERGEVVVSTANLNGNKIVEAKEVWKFVNKNDMEGLRKFLDDTAPMPKPLEDY